MKTFAAFLVGFLTITTLATPAVHASGQATMGLSPTSTTVAAGDLISLTITVNTNGESVDTARAHISYPASILQVVSFDLGTLFPSEAPGNVIDNTSGSLSEGAFKFGTPITSGGTFGTITFKAVSNGTASIQVLSDSKLISDGVEKINTSALGKATISVSGSGTTTSVPPTTTTTTNTPEQQALVYFGAFAGRLPSSSADWNANNCIAYDTCYPGSQDLAKEQQALVLYTTKYGSLPVDSIGWNAIHAIAYTNVFINWDATTPPPTTTTTTTDTTTTTPTPTDTTTTSSSSTPEQRALVYFGAFAGRMPSSSSDWDAHHCIAYDTCKSSVQDVSKEQQALVLYTTKYGSLPVDSIGWNAIHAIAYTNTFINWDATVTPPTTTTSTTTTTPVTETTTTTSVNPEQQALVYFGAFAGRMPSSSSDWDAHHCIAYDTCKSSVQDVSKEQQALVLYTTKYGSLPVDSIGWNAIHAIAYTNTFINWDATVTPPTTTDTTATTTAETTTSTTSVTTDATTELTPEQKAIGTFGKITGRSPSTDADWLAVDYIVNGYSPVHQDLDKESQALTLFVQVFGYLPSTDSDWNIMSAIAYSGAIL